MFTDITVQRLGGGGGRGGALANFCIEPNDHQFDGIIILNTANILNTAVILSAQNKSRCSMIERSPSHTKGQLF